MSSQTSSGGTTTFTIACLYSLSCHLRYGNSEAYSSLLSPTRASRCLVRQKQHVLADQQWGDDYLHHSLFVLTLMSSPIWKFRGILKPIITNKNIKVPSKAKQHVLAY